MDSETVRWIASVVDLSAQKRMKEADDARNGTGIFAGRENHALPDGQADLATIATANAIVANAFAELAADLRALAR